MGPTCLLLVFCCIAALINSGYANGGLPRIAAEDRSTLTALVGRDVQLSCPVDKNSEIMVEWYKDGQQIFVAWDRFKTNRKGLRIRNVTYEDEGTYVCKAINGFGTDEVSIGLIIKDVADYDSGAKDPSLNEGNHYPAIGFGGGGTRVSATKPSGSAPVITDAIRNHGPHFQRPVGGNLKLKCAASGDPSPQILWYKDGQEIPAKEKKLSLWALHLADLQPVDSGHYTCTATNIHGSANATFSVQVIDRFRDKPELTGTHPSNTSVDVGGTASFQCRVRSDVYPHIQWLKQLDDPSEVSAQNKTIQVGENHYRVLKSSEAITCADGSFLNKLIISRAKESDSGVYICLAANTMGYSFRSAHLLVSPVAHRDATSSVMNNERISVGVIVVVSMVGLIACIFLIVCYIRWRPKQSPPSSTSHKRSAEAPLKSSEPMSLPHAPTSLTTSLNNKKTSSTTTAIANGVSPPRTLPSTYIHQNSNSRTAADCLESTWVDMPSSRTPSQPSANTRVIWGTNGHPQSQYYHCKRGAVPPGGGLCSEIVDYRSGSAGSGGGSSMARVYHHKHSHCHCNR